MINIGLIGCGYWGPNLIRNFTKIRQCRIETIADQRPERLDAVLHLNPAMRPVTSAKEVIESDAIDAVVIATPISTHFPLAKDALLHGKHVFIEKPLARTSAEAKELITLAEGMNKVLMVDHTFIYSGAVQKVRQIIDAGELGEIFYYDSVRLNLGLFQPDVNVLWDLAPHDFSLLSYLIQKQPIHVTASGSSPVRWEGWRRESIAYVTIDLEDNTIAHFHLNWLSPVKLRRTLIGGSRKMIVYDHLDAENQVKIFDKGVDLLRSEEERYRVLVQYRTGDLTVPKVDQTEPLEIACKHFVDCIQKGQTPITDGVAGLRVVELLEAAEHSMKNERIGSYIWQPEPSPLPIVA
jgi:predicted dehydrogenase